MDVHEAEGLVLDGFEKRLKEVGFIFVELTLKEIYTGQSMASYVVKELSNDFYWYQNFNLGVW